MKIEINGGAVEQCSLLELPNNTIAQVSGDSGYLFVLKTSTGEYLKIWPKDGETEVLETELAHKLEWKCTPVPKGTILTLEA